MYQLKAVGDDSKTIEFIVEKGETLSSIATELKAKNLIKSELFYKLYLKTHDVEPLQTGKYALNQTMSVQEILEVLGKGSDYNPEVVTDVLIKEGERLEKVAETVASKTNHTAESLIKEWNKPEFIDEVINKYWFVTDEVKNKDVIYALEGYFFPATYEFLNKDVSASYIAYKFLDKTNEVLTELKAEFENSEYTVHQILTLASIVEHEAILDEDRPIVAGVFYNRLDDGWKLQSCATVGYAIGEWKLTYTYADLETDSKYNTYYYAGLPVGPGCMPGRKSIEATLKPTDTEYYYFMANVCDASNPKTYFAKTYAEHSANVKKYLSC